MFDTENNDLEMNDNVNQDEGQQNEQLENEMNDPEGNPPAPEQGQENQEPDDEPNPDNDEDLGDWKNKDPKQLAFEAKRKGEKIVKLEAKLKEIESRLNSQPNPNQQQSNQQSGKRLSRLEMAAQTEWGRNMIEEGRALGMSDKYLESQLLGMESMIGNFIHPINSRFHENDLNDSLSKQAQRDETSKIIISRYKNEITEEIKNNYAPEYWKDEKLIQAVTGQIALKHFKDIAAGGATKRQNPPNETRRTGVSIGGGAINSDVRKYMEDYGLDINNQEHVAEALRGVAAMKSATSRIT